MIFRLIILLLLMCTTLNGQEIVRTSKSYYNQFAHYIASDYKGSSNAFFQDMKAGLGLTTHDEFRLKSSNPGRHDFIHYRYTQYHQGIRIFGADYILHESDGQVKSGNGKILPMIDIGIVPSMTASEALRYAQAEMQAEVYAWEAPNHDADSKRPIPELVIVDKSVTSFTGLYKLAYAIDLYSAKPLKAFTYLIDAHTGEVIRKISKHHSSGVPGKGLTKNYGLQALTVDSIAPSEFVLHDPSRGNEGISITNSKFEEFTSSTNYFDLTNARQDEVAVDALYLTAQFYDELNKSFDWLGLDNKDASFNVIVHARGGADLVNAFWDGEHAHFGDGDCDHSPLTTHEILAHEFMHGIIDHTSGLIYADEPGAINESMCDVMGHYMEWVKDYENFSWKLGHSFQLNEDMTPLRIMDNPNSVGDPAYYKGLFWQDGDFVHTNSAIGNLFFVRLSDGGEGIANGEFPYSVEGIGIEKAAQFLFFTNRHYLTQSSDYNDY